MFCDIIIIENVIIKMVKNTTGYIVMGIVMYHLIILYGLPLYSLNINLATTVLFFPTYRHYASSSVVPSHDVMSATPPLPGNQQLLYI